MQRFFLILGTTIIVMFSTSFLYAGSVFLNGVNIDGVTNQTFSNCTVVIDKAGNILITAKGYKVQTVGNQANKTTATTANNTATTQGGSPSMHYWLVTEKSAPGMTQYDIDVYVNNKFVRRLPSKEGQVVMEITKFLQTGSNNIYFVSKKNMEGGRRSASPQHYFKIIIGEGATASGRNVLIDQEILTYKRTAAETQPYSDLLTINAQ